MICTFSTCSHKGSVGRQSEEDERDSISRESVLADDTSSSSSSSSGLVCSSSINSAGSSRESSFDELRSDSCNSDYCDDLDSDKLLSDHRGIVDVVEASQQALSVHNDKNDLLFQTLERHWLLLRDQLVLESEEARESLFENAYLMLDQDLQPITPAADIPESVRIFEEHKVLAKQYLQAQMEVEDLLQTKQDLEKQLLEQQTNGSRMSNHDMMKEWRELQSENESLVQFHKKLNRQLELIKGKGRNPQRPSSPYESEPEPDWVMVPRRET